MKDKIIIFLLFFAGGVTGWSVDPTIKTVIKDLAAMSLDETQNAGYDAYVQDLIEHHGYGELSDFFAKAPIEDPPEPELDENDPNYVPPGLQSLFALHAPEPVKLKLHVSAVVPRMEDVARVAIPYLNAHNVSHKLVLNAKRYKRLDGFQRGKMIAIYPNSEEEGIHIAHELDRLLAEKGFSPHDFIAPTGDAPWPGGKSGGIAYRYGAFVSDRVAFTDIHGQQKVAYDHREIYKPEGMGPTAVDRYAGTL